MGFTDRISLTSSINLMQLTFTSRPWAELTTAELYSILQLRQEVFIVEQDCPYLDADDKDQVSIHVCGYDQGGKLQAYARVVPSQVSYDGYTSIGRVITSSLARGKRLGTPLMEEAIKVCLDAYPDYDIKISAQVYALGFYQKLGFRVVGEEYLEDDIPHMAMVLKHD